MKRYKLMNRDFSLSIILSEELTTRKKTEFRLTIE